MKTRIPSVLLAMLAAGLLLCGCRQEQKTVTSAPQTQAAQQPEAKAERGPVTIAMVGDVMLGSIFPSPKLPPDSGRQLLRDAAPILRQASVAVGNLEGVIADSGQPRKKLEGKKFFMFMTPTAMAPLLSDAGFDLMALANNHACDFFEEGIISTERTLDALGIGHTGIRPSAFKTRREASVVKEIDGVRYGFAAFGHEWYNQPAPDSAWVSQVVGQLRKRCDVLIVNFHGGAEGSAARHLPKGGEYFYGDYRGNLRKFAHQCIDLGADIVMGSGPHVVRAIELYRGHLVCYSLGNFCTAGMGTAGLTGYAPIVTATIDAQGKLVEGQIHSFLQQGMSGPRHDAKRHAQLEIATLTREDFDNPGLELTADGKIVPKP